jgi:hypothetical protein
MGAQRTGVRVTLTIRIGEMLGSNLGSDIGSHDEFRVFTQLFQANTGIGPEISP